MWFRIDALDVLFARDTHPFGQGEAGFGSSRFPPLPSTVQGMIRSTILANALGTYNYRDFRNPKITALDPLRQAIGTRSDDLGELALIGPLVNVRPPARDLVAGLWLPTPRHAMQVVVPAATSAASNGHALTATELVAMRVGRPADSNELIHTSPIHDTTSSAPYGSGLRLLTSPEPGAEAPSDGLLPAEVIVDLLTGGRTALPTSRLLTESETRIGIALQPGVKMARDGMIYRKQVVRPGPGVHLLVDVSFRPRAGAAEASDACADLLPTPGLVRLGGDGHLSQWRQAEAPTREPVDSLLTGAKAEKLRSTFLDSGGRLALYLATPALFPDGWRPPAPVAGIPFRLVAAAVGRSVPVSGWDAEHHLPKPIRLAVPEGSVFFYEPVVDGGRTTLSMSDLCAVFDALHGKLFPGQFDGANGTQPIDFARMGFGLTLVGSWNDA